jgi:hypothetical protein
MDNDAIGEREFAYIYNLQVEELSDNIYSLPYTILEEIINYVLNNEDFLFDIFSEMYCPR